MSELRSAESRWYLTRKLATSTTLFIPMLGKPHQFVAQAWPTQSLEDTIQNRDPAPSAINPVANEICGILTYIVWRHRWFEIQISQLH